MSNGRRLLTPTLTGEIYKQQIQLAVYLMGACQCDIILKVISAISSRALHVCQPTASKSLRAGWGRGERGVCRRASWHLVHGTSVCLSVRVLFKIYDGGKKAQAYS